VNDVQKFINRVTHANEAYYAPLPVIKGQSVFRAEKNKNL
jgi:hypothetical protein